MGKRSDERLAPHPEPGCNPGYAEHEPASPGDARRGGKRKPDAESGGVDDDHAATADEVPTP